MPYDRTFSRKFEKSREIIIIAEGLKIYVRLKIDVGAENFQPRRIQIVRENQNMLRNVSRNPTIRTGIPTGAPTTVTVKIIPTIIKTSPMIAPTTLPVNLRMEAKNAQNITTG